MRTLVSAASRQEPRHGRRRLLALLAAGPALQAAAAEPLLPLALPIYSDPKTARMSIAAQDCVARAADVRWQRLHVPQARLQKLIDSGEAIGLSTSMPGSSSKFLSTRGLFNSQGWIVLPRASAWAQGRPPTAGSLSVCVIRNDDLLLLPPFERQHGRVLRLERVDGGSDAALRMLMGGRCDALLLGNRLGHEALVRNLAQRSQGLLTALAKPYVQYPIGFVSLKGGPLAHWLPVLDKAVAACGPRVRELLDEEARD